MRFCKYCNPEAIDKISSSPILFLVIFNLSEERFDNCFNKKEREIDPSKPILLLLRYKCRVVRFLNS